ncbi:MAG: hypothetical protein K2N21_07680 [Rikenellaceae bacterium]|nr:hypothetical protein [Rikenellaceae bacterium]
MQTLKVKYVMKKFVCLMLVLSGFFCLSASAQTEALALYYKACGQASRGQVDSAFMSLADCVGRMDGSYSRRYYSSFVTAPQLRVLHGDRRWEQLREELRHKKHLFEDEHIRQVPYPRKASGVGAGQASGWHYDLEVDIDVAARTVAVKGWLDIGAGEGRVSMVLWRDSRINTVAVDGKDVGYMLDTAAKSPVPYIRDGSPLYVDMPPGGGRLWLDYVCVMGERDGWEQSFGDDWIELGYYAAWYPVPVEGVPHNSTAQIAVTIDDGYRVGGSGFVTEDEGVWRMSQSWGSFDNVITASPRLNTLTCGRGDSKAVIDYIDFPDAAADSALQVCGRIFDHYIRVCGQGGGYMKFLISSSEGVGGYSRKNYVSMMATSCDERLSVDMARQIGALWWNKAPSDSWHDWLNVSFAEFMTLCYIRDTLGDGVYADYVDAYREDTRRACPVWEVDRSSSKAYAVMHKKGALMLCDLDAEIGGKRTMEFVGEVCRAGITSTGQFLDFTHERLGRQWRTWFEKRLKE